MKDNEIQISTIIYGFLLCFTLLIYLVLVCPLLALYRLFVLGKSKPDKNKIPSILYFSSIQWFEVWQRPQHCAVRVKDKFPVFYISPLPMHHILKDLRYWLQNRIYVHSKRLVVFSPILFSGENKFHFIRILNRLLIIGYTTELMIKFKISSPIIWMNNPFYAYLIDKLPYKFVVYDIMDEYTKFSIAPKDVIALEDSLLKKAKIVFTGTNSLYKAKKTNHENISFVPCGVDFEMFNKGKNITGIDATDDLLKIPPPVIGYIGGLNERIDSDLLEYIAKNRENWNLLLIGPVQRSFKLSKMYKNVILPGLKPYESLPRCVSHFDVCILPYRISEATYFINPVKLLEYMAAGKPIVSVPIPDIIEFYGKLIEIAEDYESFVKAIEKNLKSPDGKKIQEGLDLAKKKTWEYMVDTMMEKLSEEIK